MCTPCRYIFGNFFKIFQSILPWNFLYFEISKVQGWIFFYICSYSALLNCAKFYNLLNFRHNQLMPDKQLRFLLSSNTIIILMLHVHTYLVSAHLESFSHQAEKKFSFLSTAMPPACLRTHLGKRHYVGSTWERRGDGEPSVIRRRNRDQ